MNESWWRIRRSLLLVALGGSTFGLFGTTFGIDGAGDGCNYALNADYQAMYQTVGKAVIQTVSDNVFGNIGTDYDKFVRGPTTTFAQAVWDHWVDAKIPDDLPNNPIVAR
jgi:hypothetical protein